MQLVNPYSQTLYKAIHLSNLDDRNHPLVFSTARASAFFSTIYTIEDIISVLIPQLDCLSAANCSFLSRAWYRQVSGAKEFWAHKLSIIQAKASLSDPYIDFCVTRQLLHRQAFPKRYKYSPLATRDLMVALKATIYLRRLRLATYESVQIAAERIEDERQRHIGWYEVALEAIRHNQIDEAEEIVKKWLDKTPYAIQLRNQISL